MEALAVYNAEYGGLPLLGPRAVAIGLNSERVIADTGNHRIVVLDSAGAYVRSFGSYCNLTDPANTPCSDPDGDGPLVNGDGQFYEPWGGGRRGQYLCRRHLERAHPGFCAGRDVPAPLGRLRHRPG